MTDDESPGTDEAFDEALTRLVCEAVANGVDVEGGWEVRQVGTDDVVWSVEITRVETDDD